MPKGGSGGGSVAVEEVSKVLSFSLGILVVQFVLSILGFTGITIAITVYVTAIALSNMFTIDQNGVRPRDEKKETASSYMTRAGIDFGIVILGFVMWFIGGIFAGIDKTINSFKKPEDAFNDIAGGNLLIRLMFAEISHMTFFAFALFFANIFNAIVAWTKS